MVWYRFPVPRKTKQSVPCENFTKSTRIHCEKELLLHPRCLVIVLFSQGTILTHSASSWQQLTRQTPKWCVLSTTGADSVELWNATFFSVIPKGMENGFLVVWKEIQKLIRLVKMFTFFRLLSPSRRILFLILSFYPMGSYVHRAEGDFLQMGNHAN